MGFYFELALSLDRFFDQVLSGSRVATMAFEGLGDLTEARGELFYLTQVKSTLRESAIKSAIEEALDVDQYLEQIHPELRPRFRYLIQGRRGRPKIIRDLQTTSWAHFFQLLVARVAAFPVEKQVPLVAVGRAWLRGREDRPEWNYIWQRLFEKLPDDPDLLAHGRAWLVGREDRPEWTYIWHRLVETSRDADLLAQGRTWLVGREAAAGWPHVWQRLVERLPDAADLLTTDDRDLLAQGRAWLPDREDRPSGPSCGNT